MRYLRFKIPAKIQSSQFFRFFFVGGFCASLNIVILYVFTGLLNLHYLISIVIQTIIVNTIGFLLNRRFTFKKSNKKFWKELAKYHYVMLLSFLMVSILMYLFVDVLQIWYLLAFVIVTIIMIVFNFISHKKWTFKD